MAKGEKTGGRTKGTPNKRTVEALSRAEQILQLIESKYLEDDIKALTPGQRVILYSNTLEYVVPKLSRSEMTGTVKHVINVIDVD